MCPDVRLLFTSRREPEPQLRSLFLEAVGAKRRAEVAPEPRRVVGSDQTRSDWDGRGSVLADGDEKSVDTSAFSFGIWY